MYAERARKWLIALTLVTLLVGLGGVYAQEGYTLGWWTVDGGGGTLSTDNYTLRATVGQSDAGTWTRRGPYTLSGGFLVFGEDGNAILPPGNRLYLPVVTKR